MFVAHQQIVSEAKDRVSTSFEITSRCRAFQASVSIMIDPLCPRKHSTWDISEGRSIALDRLSVL